MKKISVYIISLAAALISLPVIGQKTVQPIDSVDVPLKVRAGLEISGPVIYLTDKSIMNLEVSVTGDINEKMSVYLGGGYSDYRYSQYNYSFFTKGTFYKAGLDFNLLRPEMSEGKYWAGIGFHYGLSRFTYETPTLKHDNYWGSVSTSLPEQTNWAHYLEVSGGFKAEVFRNFSIGWLVNIRKLLYTGAAEDLRPIYYPGYGAGGRSLTYGLTYFISYNFPFKKIRVAIKPDPVEEPDEDAENVDTGNTRNTGRQGIGN
jgi:hypothetical protein